MAEKFVAVYVAPRFDTVWGEDAADAARNIRSTLRKGETLLGVYPLHGPVPPKFDGFPVPPAPIKEVA